MIKRLGASNPIANLWLIVFTITACLLLVLTFIGQTWPSLEQPLEPFNLGRESAFAAWFSSAWLLWSSLLMLSLALVLFRKNKCHGLCFMLQALTGFLLCIDEAGSMHERIRLLFPSFLDLSRTKVCLVGAILLGLSLIYWRRSRAQLGEGWRFAALAYITFGTVALQELIEQRLNLPIGLSSIRTSVEEGTELLGFYLFTLAAVNTINYIDKNSQEEDAGLPKWGVIPTRHAIMVTFIVAMLMAPFFILWRLNYSAASLMPLAYHGDFASAIMMVMFLAAGWACLWRGQNGRQRKTWYVMSIGLFILSVLQNWHPYIHYRGVPENTDLTFARLCAFYDMFWALPVFAIVWLSVGPKETKPLRGVIFIALALVVAGYAALIGSLGLSYAVSYITALGIGGWWVYAALHPHINRTDTTEDLHQH